jgi:hypothetical protein
LKFALHVAGNASFDVQGHPHYEKYICACDLLAQLGDADEDVEVAEKNFGNFKWIYVVFFCNFFVWHLLGIQTSVSMDLSDQFINLDKDTCLDIQSNAIQDSWKSGDYEDSELGGIISMS